MCGARFAVFVRPARVLPSPSQATRNLSFPEVFAGARHVVVSTGCFTGLVRVGVSLVASLWLVFGMWLLRQLFASPYWYWSVVALMFSSGLSVLLG